MPRSGSTPRANLRPEALPGYTRIAGSAMRYQTPSGNIISRREYLNRQASHYGWEDLGEYQAASKAAGGLDGMRSAASSLAIYTMLNAKLEDVEERREFVRDHRAELRALAADPDSVEHDKPLAQWLVALDLRQPDWTFDVGKTP